MMAALSKKPSTTKKTQRVFGAEMLENGRTFKKSAIIPSAEKDKSDKLLEACILLLFRV